MRVASPLISLITASDSSCTWSLGNELNLRLKVQLYVRGVVGFTSQRGLDTSVPSARLVQNKHQPPLYTRSTNVCRPD